MPRSTKLVLLGTLAIAGLTMGVDMNSELMKKHRKVARETQDLLTATTDGLQNLFTVATNGASAASGVAQQAAALMTSTAAKALQDPELVQIQKLMKGQLNEMDFLSSAINSEGYKELLKQPDMVHQLIEAFPLLGAASPEIARARGRRLGNAETVAIFNNLMQGAISTMSTTLKTVADPDTMTQAMAALANDDGNEEVFAKAMDGDEDAMSSVIDMANKKLHPGLDTSVLASLGTPENIMAAYQKLTSVGDIMRQIDDDSEMSQVIRNPIHMRQALLESGMIPKPSTKTARALA